MIDLNEMAVFARVVEAGSFSAAAPALEMPKSTVSRRVARLEQRLGAQLLHRTTRRMRLTDVGSAYYERCAAVVAEAQQADLAVTNLSSVPRGTLRLTAPQLFGDAFLGPVVAEYARRYPEAHVRVTLTERLVDLVAEGFDLAIRAGPLEDSSLIARRLGAGTSYCVCSVEYARARGVPDSPSALAGHDIVGYQSARGPVPWHFDGADGPETIAVSARVAFNSFELVRVAALEGLGIANLPAFVCAADLRAGGLRRVLEDWTSDERAIHAVYASSRHLSAKVRLFLDLLVEHFSPDPPWAVDGPVGTQRQGCEAVTNRAAEPARGR